MPNALANETSPYLRQHRDNPVDWLPWGPEALRRAREEDRPILVSIGYSACHWCHVMEHESFSDAETASVMNAHFVCVKVDREERPDLDAIHMDAVQAMTGQGGWPLNVFITPEQVPFYGGTYFPPRPSHGMPAWRQVLHAVAEAWRDRRDEIREQGARMVERLSAGALMPAPGTDPDPAMLAAAVARLREGYDSVHGGWGTAPKFPAPSTIELLLRLGETSMSVYTLHAMAGGGIHDQVGGGFARYSTDERWTVPHFEKMLCDNALLARAYLHGWQATGDAVLLRTCEETLAWARREMTGPEGGFYSALDADSEGQEGRFYVWTIAELREALGEDADTAIAWFGATEQGNFTDPHHPEPPGAPGRNVLESRGPEPAPEVRERIRERLRTAREERVRPGLDDKRLAAWNGLMISAFAEAGAALGRDDLLEAARRAADFVLRDLHDADRRLLRTWSHGTGRLRAYLEDHAFLLDAFVTLHEATFEPRWLSEARTLADEILARFLDPQAGGFFSTADDHERLVARRKDLEDAPVPSGGAAAAFGLLRLGALTGEARYEEAAAGQIRLHHELAVRHPGAFAHLLQAFDLQVRPLRQVALVGPPDGVAALAAVVRERRRPDVVLTAGDGDPEGESARAVPLLAGRTALDGRATAYVCEHFACRRPVTTSDELRALLDGERPDPSSPATP